jgi:hypothetical protein
MSKMELEETLIFIVTTEGLLPNMSLQFMVSQVVSLLVINLDIEGQRDQKFRLNHFIISTTELGEMAILQLIKVDL